MMEERGISVKRPLPGYRRERSRTNREQCAAADSYDVTGDTGAAAGCFSLRASSMSRE